MLSLDYDGKDILVVVDHRRRLCHSHHPEPSRILSKKSLKIVGGSGAVGGVKRGEHPPRIS